MIQLIGTTPAINTDCGLLPAYKQASNIHLSHKSRNTLGKTVKQHKRADEQRLSKAALAERTIS